MHYSKFLNHYLDNRFSHLLFLLLVFTLNVSARNIDTNESETYDESMIQDVSYTYQLFTNSQNSLDCYGTLNFAMCLPQIQEH